MKKNIIVLVCLVSLLLASCTNSETDIKPSTDSSKDKNSESDNDWRQIDADGKFSFKVPPNVTQQEVQGMDSYVGQYVGESIHVSFDYGWYSNPLNNLDSNPDYTEKYGDIGGYNAKIVSYTLNNDPRGNYVAHTHFADIDKGQTRLTLSVYYTNSDDSDTAMKILESVRFF